MGVGRRVSGVVNAKENGCNTLTSIASHFSRDTLTATSLHRTMSSSRLKPGDNPTPTACSTNTTPVDPQAVGCLGDVDDRMLPLPSQRLSEL
jgi:hypothetical protein